MAKCERCEQLELLAQAYQDALKNTFRVLMVALQPDTSNERRAEMLLEITRGPQDASPDVEGASDGSPTPPNSKKG